MFSKSFLVAISLVLFTNAAEIETNAGLRSLESLTTKVDAGVKAGRRRRRRRFWTRRRRAPAPVNCATSAWSAWGGCSKTCAGGQQSRSRHVTVHAAHGGAGCGALTETQNCNTQPCPINCVWGAWQPYGTCDKSCGTGHQSRSRSVNTAAAHGGLACVGESTESRECNTHACPIDCKMSEWGDFGKCTKECGGGTKTKTRHVEIQPAHGGKACPTSLSYEEECNTHACPIDCILSPFGDFGECSKKCGGGVHSRTRTVKQPAEHNGKECDSLVETEDCNTQACPEHCEVSEWTSDHICSKKCGGGVITRTRKIIKEPKNGGNACGELKEETACNTQECPIDCVLSDEFTPWSKCDSECGGGTQHRQLKEKIEAQHGGRSCDAVIESQKCNTFTCPPIGNSFYAVLGDTTGRTHLRDLGYTTHCLPRASRTDPLDPYTNKHWAKHNKIAVTCCGSHSIRDDQNNEKRYIVKHSTGLNIFATRFSRNSPGIWNDMKKIFTGGGKWNNDQCLIGKNIDEAYEACKNVGLRLCTKYELEYSDDFDKGAGCNTNVNVQWTSTPCTSNDHMDKEAFALLNGRMYDSMHEQNEKGQWVPKSPPCKTKPCPKYEVCKNKDKWWLLPTLSSYECTKWVQPQASSTKATTLLR
jgi:hypothetical protein